MTAVAEPLSRCVVVGGAGAVGGMLVESFVRSGGDVCAVDVAAREHAAPARHRWLRADVTAMNPRLAAELGRADVVVLAVPETVALAAVGPVAEAMRPGALLVDTLSVKRRIVDAARTHAAELDVVSLNPMFAPSLRMEGRPVATVVVHDGPRARELLRLLDTWGGRVVRLDADEHDRLAAATQALTHAAVLAFGLALGGIDVGAADIGALAPPPHTLLLALLARIASGTPATYWDVQSANPYAAPARRALADGLRRLAALVDDGDERAFADMLAEIRDLLGPDLDHYRDLCARTFATTTGPTGR
jgi:prephenate dehydrogenase